MANNISEYPLCIQDFPPRPVHGQRQACTNGYTYRYDKPTTSWTVCGMVGVQGPRGRKDQPGNSMPPCYIDHTTETWWCYKENPVYQPEFRPNVPEPRDALPPDAPPIHQLEFIPFDTGMPCTGLNTILNLIGTLPTADALPEYYLLGDHKDGDAYIVEDTWHVWFLAKKHWHDGGPMNGVVGPKGDKGDKGEDGKDGEEGKPGEMWAIPCFTLPHRDDPLYKRGRIYLTANNLLAIAVGGNEVPQTEDGKPVYEDPYILDDTEYGTN